MALAAPAFPLQQQLRRTTHAAHVRLNRHPLLNQLTRPRLTALNYTLVLHAYWHFYQVAETHIEHCLAGGMADFNYTDRYKTDWLTQDLAHFGLTPDTASYGPTTVELEVPKNKAELIGMMYPLEGSTLGGQVISKHLRQNLGIDSTGGGRFFCGYGTNTEPLWTQFLQFAERSLEHMDERSQACEYANYLFEQLETFLDVRVP